MTLAEILAGASMASRLFNSLKAAAMAKGMSEAEFEASMKKANGKLDKFYKDAIETLDDEWKK